MAVFLKLYLQVKFEGETHWYSKKELMLFHAAVPIVQGLRYCLLQGFDLSLLKEGVSAISSLFYSPNTSQPKEQSRFPDELLGQTDPRLINFFVRKRVGGIIDDPNGPSGLAATIAGDWDSRGQRIFECDEMQQLQEKCREEVYNIIGQLHHLEVGASVASKSDLSTEMVTEKEVELEVQVVKEVLRMPPAPVDTIKPWALTLLSSRQMHQLPFFPASELSFQDVKLPFPERVSVSRNFCSCKPEGLMSVAQFVLNWNDGTHIRTTILSLAEAVAVRRAAQRQFCQTGGTEVISYEIAKISQDCKSSITIASINSITDWYSRLNCCRFIQGDIWMSWPDDFFLLQALESSGSPLCDIATPAAREKWFMQCLLSQVREYFCEFQ